MSTKNATGDPRDLPAVSLTTDQLAHILRAANQSGGNGNYEVVTTNITTSPVVPASDGSTTGNGLVITAPLEDEDLTAEDIADAIDLPVDPDDPDGADDPDDETGEVLANEVSDQELRQTLHAAIKNFYATAASSGDYGFWCDIVAVYSDSVVYNMNGKLYQQSYTVTDEKIGTVELADDAAPVRAIQRFVSLQADESAPATPNADLTNDVSKSHNPPNTNVERRSAGSNESEENTRMAAKATVQVTKDAKTSAAEAPKTRAERVAALIANARSRYLDTDAGWLGELSDAAFERVEQVACEVVEIQPPTTETAKSGEKPAVVVAPVATPAAAVTEPEDESSKPAAASEESATPAIGDEPMTTEKFLASAPPEIRRQFQAMLDRDAAEKAALVDSIFANEQNTFTKEYLQGLDTEVLGAMAKLAEKPAAAARANSGAKPAETVKPNFAGRRIQTVQRAASAATDAPRMPGFTVGDAK